MTIRPSLVRSIPFWILLVGSLATSAFGAWLAVTTLGTMSTALTAGTATPVDVYVGQVWAIVGGVLMAVVALVAFRDGPGVVVLPIIGAAFGAVAGLVYQGGRNPEREQELVTAEGAPDPSAAVAGNPPQANEH